MNCLVTVHRPLSGNLVAERKRIATMHNADKQRLSGS